MDTRFSELLEAVKKFNIDDVADAQPWWSDAREAWAKLVDKYSTHVGTLCGDPAQLQEMLPKFASQSVIFGPTGRHEIKEISFTPDGAIVLKAGDYILEAPISNVWIGRGGLAKWNTFLIVRFSHKPAIWTNYFPDSEPWALIVHKTSALCIWNKIPGDGPYCYGIQQIDCLVTVLDQTVDLIRGEGEPWSGKDWGHRRGDWPKRFEAA